MHSAITEIEPKSVVSRSGHECPCRRVSCDGNSQRNAGYGRWDPKIFDDEHENRNGGDAQRHTDEQPHMERIVVWANESVREGPGCCCTDDDRNRHAGH